MLSLSNIELETACKICIPRSTACQHRFCVAPASSLLSNLQELSKADSPTADGSPKENEKIAELRLGLDTMRKAMESYFGVIYNVARLLPPSERKEFVNNFKGDQ